MNFDGGHLYGSRLESLTDPAANEERVNLFASTGGFMNEHIYKQIELTGSSKTSMEDAVQNAISKASKTLHNRGFKSSRAAAISRTTRLITRK